MTVIADRHKSKKAIDPWFSDSLKSDADWLKVFGSDSWSVEDWTVFWKACVWLPITRKSKS